MTRAELRAHQLVAGDALLAALERRDALRRGTAARLEWAFIVEACRREFYRLGRAVARTEVTP